LASDSCGTSLVRYEQKPTKKRKIVNFQNNINLLIIGICFISLSIDDSGS